MIKAHTVWLSTVAMICVGDVTALAQSAPETSTVETSGHPNSTRADPALVPTPSDLAAGKLVQSPEGKTVGTIKDIVPDAKTGEPAYVLIATASGTAAIPYWAVSHLLRDAHLVIDRSLLTSAPRVREDQIRDGSDTAWKKQADRYWHSYR